MDIGDWLRNLGLDQYEAAFRQNEVDGEILPKLTAEDLRDLGGVAVGHRGKLLAAIAELGRPPPKAGEGSKPPANEPSAERRYLTVMFCDLVGSTSLAAKLDPEDWGNLVGAYLD